MKHIFILIITAWLFLPHKATGQDSAAFTCSGYLEVYYSFDFDNPSTHEKPAFIYNYKRHNEVNINLTYAKVNYSSAKVRSNLALMAGTYAQYNLASEPEALRFLYEASIGVKLSRTHNIWIDAGIMPSHIGSESAVGADCWTASRSIVAENSPYYETGIKLTSTNKKENFFMALLLLNGWQHIEKPVGINEPSFGLQLNYKPKDNLTLNYSNFIGTDKPDTLHAWRNYHNLYATYQINKSWGVTGGFDFGGDKNQTREHAWWYSPVVILKRSITSASSLAIRGEYFSDIKQILLTTNTANGFQTFGVSVNYDYLITKNALIRAEGKEYFSKDKIFKQGKENNNYSLLITMSLRL